MYVVGLSLSVTQGSIIDRPFTQDTLLSLLFLAPNQPMSRHPDNPTQRPAHSLASTLVLRSMAIGLSVAQT